MRVLDSESGYTSRWRSAVAACLLACCLLALAGCGGSSNKHHSTAASTQPTTSTSTAPSTPSLKPGLGSVDTNLGVLNTHMQVTLFDVRRQGPLTIVDFGMACRETTRDCHLDDLFEDRSCDSQPTQPMCGPNAGGLLLVDPRGNRQYGVVRDAQAHPYASNQSGNMPPGGRPQLGFAVFPQLPAGVSSIDVAFPQGGPVFLDVPVTTGPGAQPATAGTDVLPAEGAGPYSGPAKNSTAGLTLPVSPLSLTVGSPAGSDREGAHTATFTLRSDVLFAFNKSKLSARAHSILSGLASEIKARAAGSVQVTGYTDSIGSDAVNLPLSRARAAAVVGALRPQTPGVSYASRGKGSADPVAPNTTASGADYPPGRALNRRVTIVVPVRAPAKPAPPTASPASAATSSTSTSPVTLNPGKNLNESYTVAPVGLHSDGNLAVLNLDATCHGPDKGCLPGIDFAGTTSVPPISLNTVGGEHALLRGQFTANVPSGVYLTDPRTGKIYTAVTDSAGNPLTIQSGPSGGNDGDMIPMWLYFAAPPSGSSTMTVHLPGESPTLTLPVESLSGPTVTH